MKNKILIFGGTTEGRELADILRHSGIDHEVSVATEYGRKIELDSGEDQVISGRLDKEKIVSLLKDGFGAVVDATHPFAVKASEEIKGACDELELPYLRLSRSMGKEAKGSENIIFVDTMEEAGDALNSIPGELFLLTGSKDLQTITSRIEDRSRLHVRVLPSVDSIALCEKAGISGKQIIAMQGPFSREMNELQIKEIGAAAILTKESGRTGGYYEKLQAAADLGIKAVVIRNPELKDEKTEHLSMEEVLGRIEEICGVKLQEDIGGGKRTITLAGIGPGDERYLTSQVRDAINKADVIFGAGTVVERLHNLSVPSHCYYEADKIIDYLDGHEELVRPVIVYSGDISVSSGAGKAQKAFEKAGFEMVKLSGISSVTLFANRLGIALEKTRVVSAHGRRCNVAGYASRYEMLIVLPSGVEDAVNICSELLEKYDITVGLELGTDKELILEVSKDSSKADNMGIPKGYEKAKVILYIYNPDYRASKVIAALSDDEIIRGEVPMTKEEIRALSIRKLALTPGSVLFDIGAGTGSISLESAMTHPDITVFSFERNKEALELLEINRYKFGLSNMKIIPGEAPDSFGTARGDYEGAFTPTHVFVGGSGKKLGEIIKAVTAMNPKVRIVLNCVTLETLAEITAIAKETNGFEADILQVAVTRYNQRGSYHLADAMNPVFIVTLCGVD